MRFDLASGQVLFHDDRAVGIMATKQNAPEFVQALGEMRVHCFGRTAALTDEPYGLDEFDEYYRQLAVVDANGRTLIAGLRVAEGAELLAAGQRFYTERYWSFLDSAKDHMNSAVDLGRVWVNPAFQKRFHGLSLLFKSLAFFLDRPGALTSKPILLGSAPLTGYHPDACDLIMRYLEQYHRGETTFVAPRHPPVRAAPFDSPGQQSQQVAFVELYRALDALGYRMPVLLRHYIRLGAQLGGDFAWDSEGRRVMCFVYHSSLRGAIARFKSI